VVAARHERRYSPAPTAPVRTQRPADAEAEIEEAVGV